MNFRDQLKSNNSLGGCQNQNVVWEKKTIKKPNAPPKYLQGKGEVPYQWEISNNHKSSKSSRNISPNKTTKDKTTDNHGIMYTPRPHQFANIVSDVREASGGWNTQSNEAIERFVKERQRNHVAKPVEQNRSDSCNNTISSGSSESYKTTLQDSYEIRKTCNEQVTSDKQITSETMIKYDIKRYKKNALMLGLLRNVDDTEVEREDTTTESSEDYYETNSFDDVASGITNLNINDENVLQNERIGRFFQSQEDEDVYYHPLKEQIQKDPEWQNLRLKRKGIETVTSSRQYFLDIKDDEFRFESRTKNN